MAMTAYDSVDDYIAAQPAPVQALFERVRKTIRKAVPRAEESVSYKIPTYKLNDRPLLYFAAWKKHWSLYPASPKLVKALGDDLEPYEVEKGTIRFPYDDSIPMKLITKIAKLRAKEV